jgi:hypothetical protein
LRDKVRQMEFMAIERYKGIHQEIDQLFDDIEKEFTPR